mgnify:CR=1 FL=1
MIPTPSLFDEFAYCDETGGSKAPLPESAVSIIFLNNANYESVDVFNDWIEHGWEPAFDASGDAFRYVK